MIVFKRFILGTLMLVVFQTGLLARDGSTSPVLTSNLVSLFGVGDLNVNLELPTSFDNSLLVGVHVNPDPVAKTISGEVGGYIGYRVYTGLFHKTVDVEDYIQFTGGINKFSVDPTGSFDIEGIYSPSVELWYGISKTYPKDLTHDIAIGVSRVFNTYSMTKIMVGYNFGMIF